MSRIPGGIAIAPPKGYRHSPETRAKISAARMGIPSPCGMKGKRHSEETRRKQREGMLGNKNRKGAPLSEEHLRKLYEGKKGIPRSAEVKRKIGDAMKGPKHPQWLGGISFEPYCVKFNREFKERVRDFFGRVCVECGAPENDRALSVHHVNYRKDACCDDGAIPLFVPLCVACHARTHHNREYWEARFTALIAEKYGGQCYLPKPNL